MHLKNFDPFDFKKKIINGVPVYYKNIPWAPCIHVNIVFNTGALADEIGKEGTAHFLEHVTLKGSPKLPNEKAVYEWKKKYTLGTSNAFTSYYNICYTFKSYPKNYEKVMLDLKDMIFNSFIKEDLVENERQVILQEAWNRYNNEKYLKYLKEVRRNTYHGHIYNRFLSPLGFPETIKKINRQDLINYHQKNFGIGNMDIILVGNVDNKKLNFIKEFLKDVPILKNFKPNRKIQNINNPIKNLIQKKANEIGIEREQVEIGINVVTKKLEYKKRSIYYLANKLLQELFFEKFRIEYKLCYGVRTYTNNNKNTFSIGMNIKTDEKNIPLIKKEFRNIINDFNSDKFKKRFLQTKTVVLETLETSENNSTEIIELSQYILAVYGEILTKKQDLSAIKKTEFKDVQKFIKEMFGDEKKIYTEIILPSKKEDKKVKKAIKKNVKNKK